MTPSQRGDLSARSPFEHFQANFRDPETGMSAPLQTIGNHIALWRMRLKDPCFVYVVQEDGDEAIKVGTARDPLERLKTLQTGNRRELRLLYVLPGTHDTEAYFHRRLWLCRVRGEWFEGEAVPPFLDYIADLARKMVDQYVPGSGEAPHVFDVEAPRTRTVRRKPLKPGYPVTVRFAKPEPKMDPVVAQAVRAGTRSLPK